MNITDENLLTEQEVARMLRISVGTIRRRRLFRQPPEFLKIGSSIRYTPESVRQLIESAVCAPVAQPVQPDKRETRIKSSKSGRRNAR